MRLWRRCPDLADVVQLRDQRDAPLGDVSDEPVQSARESAAGRRIERAGCEVDAADPERHVGGVERHPLPFGELFVGEIVLAVGERPERLNRQQPNTCLSVSIGQQ